MPAGAYGDDRGAHARSGRRGRVTEHEAERRARTPRRARRRRRRARRRVRRRAPPSGRRCRGWRRAARRASASTAPSALKCSGRTARARARRRRRRPAPSRRGAAARNGSSSSVSAIATEISGAVPIRIAAREGPASRTADDQDDLRGARRDEPDEQRTARGRAAWTSLPTIDGIATTRGEHERRSRASRPRPAYGVDAARRGRGGRRRAAPRRARRRARRRGRRARY